MVYQYAREDATEDALNALSQDVDAAVLGATAELSGLGGVDWYGEADWFHYTSGELLGKEEAEDGYALYASGAAYFGALTVLAEAKAYKNTEGVNALAGSEGYELASGPTLEYERVILRTRRRPSIQRHSGGTTVFPLDGAWVPHFEIISLHHDRWLNSSDA